MTKTKFFIACASCDQKYAHQLRVTSMRQYRGMDNQIVLSGSTWCQGGLTDYDIYTPLKGRQGHGNHPYKKANEMIEKELPKYKKWLKEWKILHNIPLDKEESK